MNKTKNNVKIDKGMLSLALKKAKGMNIALNGTKLANFMLHRVIDDGLEITINCVAFAWDEEHNTTMYWDTERVEKFKKKCSDKGLRDDYSFIFNLLIWNFLYDYNG